MKKYLFVALVVSLFGCAEMAVKKGPDPKIQAKIKSLMARETTALSSTESAGDLKVKVLSKGKPQSKLESDSKPLQYSLHIPIGAESDVDCTITEQIAFPAMTLQGVFDNIAKLPNIESVGIKTIESDVFNNIGYIYLEAEYLTKEKQYGTAKLIASSTMNMSLYCSHDELGYKKTFIKAVDSLARSGYVQKFVNKLSDYDKKQLDIVYLNNRPIGYSESYQFTEDKNEKETMSVSAMLLPRSQNALMSSDSFDKTIYDGEAGHLLSGVHYSYENGETSHELEIEKTATRKYQVTGEFEGKKINQSFESEQPLIASDYILDLYIDGKTSKKEWSFEEYVPLSPVKPSKNRIVLKGKTPKGDKIVEYFFQSAKAELQIDGKSYSQMKLEAGNASFLMKRKLFDAKSK